MKVTFNILIVYFKNKEFTINDAEALIHAIYNVQEYSTFQDQDHAPFNIINFFGVNLSDDNVVVKISASDVEQTKFWERLPHFKIQLQQHEHDEKRGKESSIKPLSPILLEQMEFKEVVDLVEIKRK